MDENTGIVPEISENSSSDGISFSGGSDNAYIKEFASSPKKERTIEEIEQEELKVAEKQAELRERTARRREEMENRRRERSARASDAQELDDILPDRLRNEIDTSESADPAPEQPEEFSFNAEAVSEEPVFAGAEAAEAASALPAAEINLKDAHLVTPVSEEESEVAVPPAEPKKLSLFARIFSESKGFTVFSVITGALLAVWDILYIVTVIARDVMMSKAVSTMALQGVTEFQAEFTSPSLTILKIAAYLLIALILVWAIVFKASDSKNKSYNKKTVIVILCLIVAAAIIAVFDVAVAHLVLT